MFKPPLNIRYAEKVATELGFSVEQLDPFSGYILRVSQVGKVGKAGKTVFVGAGNVSGFPINSVSIANLVTDKAHTHDLLRAEGIATPKSRIVFLLDGFADLRPAGFDRDDGEAFATELGFPVFVKPNRGARGRYARSVKDAGGLRAHFDLIARDYDTAIVQEYLPGREARLFAIDGKPKFYYERVPAVLTGDGSRSVEALLDAADAFAHRQGLPAQSRDNPVLTDTLGRRGYTLTSIPAPGETLAYCEIPNASVGGSSNSFRTTFLAEEEALCARIFEATHLRACAIDLVYPRDRPCDDAFVIEINANPALTTLETIGETTLLEDIWREILIKAFE
jgi:glutathione synthase/RimK-type ligase-like ATP-grasp enzyme